MAKSPPAPLRNHALKKIVCQCACPVCCARSHRCRKWVASGRVGLSASSAQTIVQQAESGGPGEREWVEMMRDGARGDLPKSTTLPRGTLEAVVVQQNMYAFTFDSGCNQGHAMRHFSLHPDGNLSIVAQG
jgi:hypothetical protein